MRNFLKHIIRFHKNESILVFIALALKYFPGSALHINKALSGKLILAPLSRGVTFLLEDYAQISAWKPA